MFNRLSLLFIAATCSFAACKAGKQSGAAPAGTTAAASPGASNSGSSAVANPMQQNNSSVLTQEQAKSAPATFRLMVTFISIGAGTDPDGKNRLDAYILDYKTRTGKSPAYVMIPWGREGEVDCCFSLNELSAPEQEQFIAGLRNTMTGRELIQISENARNRFRP